MELPDVGKLIVNYQKDSKVNVLFMHLPLSLFILYIIYCIFFPKILLGLPSLIFISATVS